MKNLYLCIWRKDDLTGIRKRSTVSCRDIRKLIIIAVNKLVMGFIDNGSMAGILSTPNSRGKIIITQLLSLYIWLPAFGSGRCIFYKERFDIVRGANQSVTLLFRHIKIVNLHKIK